MWFENKKIAISVRHTVEKIFGEKISRYLIIIERSQYPTEFARANTY
jgi:hypothetical protein